MRWDHEADYEDTTLVTPETGQRTASDLDDGFFWGVAAVVAAGAALAVVVGLVQAIGP